ncbi:hypothetical protein [Hymenobacter sp. GOD-10R]|uniref:hypothetical protein n=1 Tax=Hymenobacter sp. GOD-10R TaxID=3093922 RepID=UPI002D79338C|nr:hypothetical protein [Hymenobacter sp. GOD-10R]WRQ31158.1 hypothetical protein SD425_12900 [Hymenobacter sp. GOD-10R]
MLFTHTIKHELSPQAPTKQARLAHRQYLGAVRSDQGRVLFYVVTEFYTVPAAQSAHGHSRVVLLAVQQRPAGQYVVDLPGELPYQPERNTLYFRYQDTQQRWLVHTQRLRTKMPRTICVEPATNCFLLEMQVAPSYKHQDE